VAIIAWISPETSATSCLTFFAGSDGCTTSMPTWVASGVTPMKSLSVSYGIVLRDHGGRRQHQRDQACGYGEKNAFHACLQS